MKKVLLITRDGCKKENRYLRTLLAWRNFQVFEKNVEEALKDTRLFFDLIVVNLAELTEDYLKFLNRARAAEKRIPTLIITDRAYTEKMKEIARTLKVYTHGRPVEINDYHDLFNTIQNIFRLRRKAIWRRKRGKKIKMGVNRITSRIKNALSVIKNFKA